MLAFTDAVFAIAITLLVVGLEVPSLKNGSDQSELLRGLRDAAPDVASFVISFAVIGRYYMAHHAFASLLAAIDRRLLALTLVYLAFIAFLPFPTMLLGDHFENGVAVAVYALIVGSVSAMEVVLFVHAHRAGLLKRSPPARVLRWGLLASSLPAVFFFASVPVALFSSVLAVAMWFVAVPVELWLERRKPAGADEYLTA